MHIVQNFGKEFGTFFENQPCIDFTMITFLGLFPREMIIYVYINIHAYMYSLEYYLAIKMNELLIDYNNLMSHF